MKKTLFCALVALLSWGATHAQSFVFDPILGHQEPLNAPQLRAEGESVRYLKSFEAKDGTETYQYFWDENNRLSHYTRVIKGGENNLNAIDSLTYDEQGRLIRWDDWQEYVTDRFAHASYNEFTYNEQGLMATRTNYNAMYNEWVIGGTYEYTYNEDGTLKRSDLYMGKSRKHFQSFEYFYEEGKLVKELWMQQGFSGELENAQLVEYTYEEGKKEVAKSTWDAGRSDWNYSSKDVYLYDDAGNCLEKQTWNTTRLVTKYTYDFDDRLVAETLLPINVKIEHPSFYNNVNLYTMEHYYSIDPTDVEKGLQHYTDFRPVYSDDMGDSWGDDTAVADVNAQPRVALYPNPATNVAYLNGLPAGQTVYLYSVDGALLRTAVADNTGALTLDLHNVPAGRYAVLSDSVTLPLVVK